MKKDNIKFNHKSFILTVAVSTIFSLLFFNFALAQSSMSDILTMAGETGAGFSEVTETSVSEYIGSIIKYALSFLGVIFIILIIYGGFLWMTASGDNDQITKAKDVIKSSVIGLVIVVSAYTLSYYILSKIFLSIGQ